VIKIKKLNEDRLEKIKGGEGIATGVWIGLAITAAVIFISGVIEGITNPERCNG
jgi:hypothetical protein